MEYSGVLKVEYKHYDRQKCFVAHSLGAEWSEDLKSACESALPRFNLAPWYAADYFDPTQPLRDKVVELIANARYGIYDLSSWQDKQGNWHLPRNVFIELGIAIALNRPTLLLRHSSNQHLPLPAGLQGIEIVHFAGDITLKKELEKQLPQWLNVPPNRGWFNRFCSFGDRACSFREQHPRTQQWEQQTLQCHIADGLDKTHPSYCQSECDEIRGAFESIFSRYSDIKYSYLDDQSVANGYQFLLCSHCQTVRSTPFAIYRIAPTTSAETFITIGISIVLEKLFEYKIPRILLVRQEQDLPSLLRGYEVVEAVNTKEIKQQLQTFLPNVIKVIRQANRKPKILPFIEVKNSPEIDAIASVQEEKFLQEISIDELQLSTRIVKQLKLIQVNSLWDLSQLSSADLIKIKGIGKKSLKDIEESLQQFSGRTLSKTNVTSEDMNRLEVNNNLLDPKVLILDDDELWLSTHELRLTKAGLICHPTQFAKEAIAAAKRNPLIKFALVDEVLYMPPIPIQEEMRELQRWQGHGVIREIHSVRPDIQFVVITDAPDLASVAQGGDRQVFGRKTAKLRRQVGVIDLIHKIDIQVDPDSSYGWLIDLLKRSGMPN